MSVALAAHHRRVLVQAAVGVVCVAVVVVGLWLAAGFAGSAAAADATTPARATVTATASCQGGDTQDTVSYRLDGAAHTAKLDGCGHQRGEQLSVLVSAGSGVVEPSDAAPGNSSGLSHRVAFLLLIVATVVGGAFAYRFFRTARRRPAFTPEPPAVEPDVDYHSDIRPVPHGRPRPVPRDDDPEATGVDWFEDSSTELKPVPPPSDVSESADRS